MKTTKLEFKSAENDQEVVISGYASVFGVLDSANDIIMKGAFEKSLRDTKKSVKFLWQHDFASPIGKIQKIFEDEYGLYIEAILTPGTVKGMESIDLVKKNILDSLSIGFNVIESHINHENKRIITEIDLWEVSLVTFPANSDSKISHNFHKSNNQIINEDIQMKNFLEIGITDHKPNNSQLANFIKGIKSPDEYKYLGSDSDERGGFAVSPDQFSSIIERISQISPLRQLASIETISSNALELLIQAGAFDSGWTTEVDPRGDTENASILQKRIDVHEIYAQPKATQRLLDDAFVNIENWITSQLVQSFAEKENQAFVSGDGVNKPKGFLKCEDVAKLKVTEAGKVSFDDILNLINSLEENYQSNAAFLMNRRTLAALRSIKDANGRFVLQPSISQAYPNTLFGIPVFCASEMPLLEAGKTPVAIADFKKGYKIVDRQGITIMKDPYTEKPFIKFYATKRVGGDVIDPRAIKLLEV
ncbi:MAG: phage major capsid protein [Rickettsiaceae bacterium]|nr:phage major capsid protein [Rickettsiaceae bacterium]